MTHNPFIIAEAGSTHDGVFDNMMECITVAHRAGANAVKFQWHSDSDKLAARMHAPEARDVYRRYAWPQEWLPFLRDEAHAKGLEFLCTVDLLEDIAIVAPFVDRFKIASWGALDNDFIKAHLEHEKPVIISTGTLDEEELAELSSWWWIDDRVSLLHCISRYPCPLEKCNLTALRDFDLAGWSDHTANPLTGALAVAAGAHILEVHFRLERTESANPDFPVSLSPGGLQSYIYLARRAAEAMGDHGMFRTPEEEAMRKHRYANR